MNKKLDTKVKDLTRNFRCHQGVLNFTQALVEAIVKFFRDTTDELPREYSTMTGDIPLLVSDIPETAMLAQLKASGGFQIARRRLLDADGSGSGATVVVDSIVLDRDHVVLV